MKKLFATLFGLSALLGAATLSGCNTVEGAGKDVERAGEGIQNANCTSADAKTDPNCQK